MRAVGLHPLPLELSASASSSYATAPRPLRFSTNFCIAGITPRSPLLSMIDTVLTLSLGTVTAGHTQDWVVQVRLPTGVLNW